jgi:tellurite resistance-related uncharacterized protein
MTIDGKQQTPSALPPDLEAYRNTPEFTEATIPAALLRSHSTATGVWGVIHILQGKLRYRVLDPFSERILEPGQLPGVIEPAVLHEVAPVGPVHFYVQFHRARKGPEMAAS